MNSRCSRGGRLRVVTWFSAGVPVPAAARRRDPSFNTVESLSWPPQGFTTRTGGRWHGRPTGRGKRCGTRSRWRSAATAIALVLGTLAAFALQRYRFFGQNALSFVFLLPIALPGIVTGIALQNTFNRTIDLGPLELPRRLRVPLARHRPRHVLRRHRLQQRVARLRRLSPNLLEASADLGAHGIQTFRYVTFPLMRSALRGRRAPGVRAELRRDRRHHLHGRIGLRDAAAVDLWRHHRAPTTCPR